MPNENIEKVIDNKEIIDFDNYLYYRNEIGSTLYGINQTLNKFIRVE